MTIAPELGDNASSLLRQSHVSGYGPRVAATPRRTPQRTVAVEQDDWRDLDTAARRAGYERAVVVRAFIRWYIRRPGAQLPQRPGD